MARAKSKGKVQGLVGESALLLSVIYQAKKDLTSGTAEQAEDAAAYFDGPDYTNHLQWLGLPNEWRPSIVEKHKRKRGL